MALNINLTPPKSFEKMAFRKKLAFWILNAGKTIIILTECVVLVVFVLRFYLDRRITNLSESIAEKSAALEKEVAFETEFNKVQQKADFLKKVSDNTLDYKNRIDVLLKNTPGDITITNLEINGKTAFYTATTTQISGFARLVENFTKEKSVSSIILREVNFSGGGNKYVFSVEVVVK